MTNVIQAARPNPELVERAREQMDAVLARSATDAPFRQQLLTDSRSALSSHFGREIPTDVNIAFVENHADATLVLPNAVDPDAELSDAQLESVAGGLYTLVPAVVIAICMIIDKSDE